MRWAAAPIPGISDCYVKSTTVIGTRRTAERCLRRIGPEATAVAPPSACSHEILKTHKIVGCSRSASDELHKLIEDVRQGTLKLH